MLVLWLLVGSVVEVLGESLVKHVVLNQSQSISDVFATMPKVGGDIILEVFYILFI